MGIAAMKLGAESVFAVDHDPQAIEATLNNARFNDVELDVAFNIPGERKFDVVVANIVQNTLIEYSEPLSEALSGSGTILLTGLLDRQQHRVQSAYSCLALITAYQEENWILMVGQRSE